MIEFLVPILSIAAIAGIVLLMGKKARNAFPKGWIFGARINGFNASFGMGDRPTLTKNGFAFDFLEHGHGEVHAITRECTGLDDTVTMLWRGTDLDVLPVEEPDKMATISLYIHEKGLDWKDPDARWYSEFAFILKNGDNLSIFTMKDWRNVNGQSDNARFAQALRNVERVGLAFGSRDRRSHGVAGSGRFELLRLDGVR